MNIETTEILDSIRTTPATDTVSYYTFLSENIDKIKESISAIPVQSKRDLIIKDTLNVIQDMIAKYQSDSTKITLFFYSILLNTPFNSYNCSTISTVINYLKESNLKIEHCFFMYRYISHIIFITNHLQTVENQIALWNYFSYCLDTYKKSIPILNELKPIPKEKRNQDFYVIICSQFLSEEHGPTKTTLDRCKTIIESMQKKVLLINCAECMSPAGGIMLYNSRFGNYYSNYSSLDTVSWKNVSIPFFQCDQNMPDTEVISMLLQTIYNMAPNLVIDISGSSVLGNLCNQFIPTLAVSLCPSMLAPTEEDYQAFGQHMTEEEYYILNGTGYSSSHIIESTFTSGLIEQKIHLSKPDLNISDDRFNIVVIGCRLNDEISEQFIAMMRKFPADKVCFNFCGIFDHYETFLHSHPDLENQCRFLGFQNDILAVLDLMNLYVNPTRRGGGTSCVESLSKGVPAVTTRFGDVYANAGEAFAVSDYDEMYVTISKYINDAEFYHSQKNLAQKRAAVLLDTNHEFQRILRLCKR